VTLAGHPLLIDAEGWRQIVSELRALLKGTARVGDRISIMDHPPKPWEGPAAIFEVQTIRWTSAALLAVQDRAAQNLKASLEEIFAEEIFATALVHGLGVDHPRIGWHLPTRPDGAEGLVTSALELIKLPRSSGDLLSDMKAVKSALRMGGDPGDVSLSAGLFGGTAALEDAEHVVPEGWLPISAPAYLEFDLRGTKLSARRYPMEGLGTEALWRVFPVLEALADAGAMPEQGAWIAEDFPQDDAAPDTPPVAPILQASVETSEPQIAMPSPLLMDRLRPIFAEYLDMEAAELPETADFFALGGDDASASRCPARKPHRA